MCRRWSVVVALLAVAATACGTAQPVAGDAGETPPAAPISSAAPTTPGDPTAEATPRLDAGATAAAPDAAPSDTAASGAAASAAAPSESAARPSCRPIERPLLQSGAHLLGGQEPPVPYSSQPPTSGWHSSGQFAVDVRGPGDPLSEPDQVSVLEADGVVVAYRAIPREQRRRLAERVRSRYDGRVAVTPYRDLARGEVAFTAWGVLRRCDGVDLAALDRFVRRFATTEAITPGH